MTVAKPLRRSAFAQALFDAKAQGFYCPDVELVWSRAAAQDGCHLGSALLFAYETH